MNGVPMKLALAGLTSLAALTASLHAAADPRPNVVTLRTVVINGRAPVPVVAVDVNRARPTAPLAELRHPVLDAVDQAAHAAPF